MWHMCKHAHSGWIRISILLHSWHAPACSAVCQTIQLRVMQAQTGQNQHFGRRVQSPVRLGCFGLNGRQQEPLQVISLLSVSRLKRDRLAECRQRQPIQARIHLVIPGQAAGLTQRKQNTYSVSQQLALTCHGRGVPCKLVGRILRTRNCGQKQGQQ